MPPPAGEGLVAEHGRVTLPVGTWQEQRGHTVSQPHRGQLGQRHTYIFSMSSFSSKAPGRSRLFPRTRTCRKRGEGTPEAPGHQKGTWFCQPEVDPTFDAGQPQPLHQGGPGLRKSLQ